MTHDANPTCLSNLRLDALMVGDLESAAIREAEQHLASCARCSARRRELAEVAEDLFTRRPTLRRTEKVAPSPPPRPTSSRSGGSGPGRRSALAAAAGVVSLAAVALFFFGGRPGGQRTKGASLVFEVFSLGPAGDVALVVDGDRLSPGDRLRFRVTSAHPGYVGVVSVDPTGAVSSYLPLATHLAPLPEGHPVELDGSAELDQHLGRERLIAVVCPLPVETAEVLRDAPHLPNVLEGCSTATLSFEKVPRRR